MKMDEVLLNVLQGLGKEDFKTFKWHLQKGDSPIPKSKLEKADETDTVDLMVQKYESSGAVDVAKEVLKKINRNDLVQRLSNSSTEPKVCNSSVGPSSYQTPDLPTSKPTDGKASAGSGKSGKAALVNMLSDAVDVAKQVFKNVSKNDQVQCSSNSGAGPEVCNSSVGSSSSQTPDLPTSRPTDGKASAVSVCNSGVGSSSPQTPDPPTSRQTDVYKSSVGSSSSLAHCLPTNRQPDVKASAFSALGSSNSSLRDLDLSYNHPGTSRMKLLSDELEDPCWRLDTLRLTGSSITDVGLGSTLRSSPSPLRKQDLSVNHVGDSRVKMLSTGLDDPHWRLDTLRAEHGGEQRLTSGLRKYSCELPLGTNTFVSYNNPTVTTLNRSFPELLHRSDLSSNLLRRNY
ncbi:uncharacterized protein LOC121906694 isoform X1 [Thunnus maccoyii]|uniref:uncharacterized protein LOC121906694 isoform X1 n=1 Tax=Thunnus maccoyii TaxID=8240 RepID=UPI001C4C8E0B|nr:uncharacterized protein LOC121906694 isoform X1 [Thunnus maccoyii]